MVPLAYLTSWYTFVFKVRVIDLTLENAIRNILFKKDYQNEKLPEKVSYIWHCKCLFRLFFGKWNLATQLQRNHGKNLGQILFSSCAKRQIFHCGLKNLNFHFKFGLKWTVSENINTTEKWTTTPSKSEYIILSFFFLPAFPYYTSLFSLFFFFFFFLTFPATYTSSKLSPLHLHHLSIVGIKSYNQI